MDLQLNGKTAVVTGSTAGIGLAIASLLAREGATVVINGRTQERVDEAKPGEWWAMLEPVFDLNWPQHRPKAARP